MAIGICILIATLNVNGLNEPTKRQTDYMDIKKEKDTYVWCLPEDHLRPRDTYRLKVRGWKKLFHANRN